MFCHDVSERFECFVMVCHSDSDFFSRCVRANLTYSHDVSERFCVALDPSKKLNEEQLQAADLRQVVNANLRT